MAEAKWTWKAAPELMERLRVAQNEIAAQDVMTWAGFCRNAAELLAHVERCEQRVQRAAERIAR